MSRHSTGIDEFDERIGGGLLPGTLTVVVGATGIGKTQLGLQFAQAGQSQEGKRGVVFDLSARGDSQSHADYARRMFDWSLAPVPPDCQLDLSDFYNSNQLQGDYLHIFDYQGRRVTKQDLDFEQWRNWQAELNNKLRHAIGFLYRSFVAGRRRVVMDGVEPTGRPHESIQFNLFEYLYHQVIRKDPEWVARDLFREHYRKYSADAAANTYLPGSVSCLLLYTSSEAMLDELIRRPLDEGDALSNANTLIYMGKIRDGLRVGRGLHVAKHRGSACSEEIIPYQIDERGIQLSC